MVIVALPPVGPGTSTVRVASNDCASRGMSNTCTGSGGSFSCAVVRCTLASPAVPLAGGGGFVHAHHLLRRVAHLRRVEVDRRRLEVQLAVDAVDLQERVVQPRRAGPFGGQGDARAQVLHAAELAGPLAVEFARAFAVGLAEPDGASITSSASSFSQAGCRRCRRG